MTCITHHACECIEADRKQLRAEAERLRGLPFGDRMYAAIKSRMETAESDLAEAVEVLRGFCFQRLSADMDAEEFEDADFVCAYDRFIIEARAFLARLEVK